MAETQRATNIAATLAAPRNWTTSRVFWTALAALFAAGLLLPAAGSVDDTFITFRYAENLIRGHGLCFNPGEIIEGYTSFGQLLLVAPFAAAKWLVGPWALALGLAAWAGVVALAWRRMAQELGGRPPAFAERLALLYLTLCLPAATWAWSGMEPALLAFAWLAAWTAHLREYEANRWPWRSGLLTFAAGLLHPEGVLIGLALGISWFWPLKSGKAARGLACGAIGGGLFALYWLGRWRYFGDFMPNTFYAKVGGHWPWRAGLQYVVDAAVSGLAPLLLIGLVAAELKNRRRWPRWLVLALAIVAVLVGYNVLIGGDYFAFNRFLVPALPFLVLATWRLWRDRRPAAALGAAPPPRHPWLRPAAVMVPVLLWSAFIPHLQFVEHLFFHRAVAENVKAGRMFRRSVPRDALVATIPIGAFGYFSEARILDMMGLTDKHIARLDVATGRGAAGHEKYDYAYVFGRRPDIIMQLPLLFPGDEAGMRAWLRQSTISIQQYAIYDRPELARDYELCWHFVEHRAPTAWRRGAAPVDLGVFAYLRKDHLAQAPYWDWKQFRPDVAALPFREGPNYIAANRRLLGRFTLGNFHFVDEPLRAGPAATPAS
jgi:hypothetical protein